MNGVNSDAQGMDGWEQGAALQTSSLPAVALLPPCMAAAALHRVVCRSYLLCLLLSAAWRSGRPAGQTSLSFRQPLCLTRSLSNPQGWGDPGPIGQHGRCWG